MMSHAKVHLAVNYCILIGLVIIMIMIMHARLAGATTADAHAALALHLPNSLWKKYLRDSNNMCEGRLVCNSVSGVDTVLVEIIKGYDWRVLSSAPQTLSPRVITTYNTLPKCILYQCPCPPSENSSQLTCHYTIILQTDGERSYRLI